MSHLPEQGRCVVCRKRTPVWPSGWLRTDDGRDFCPDHKADPSDELAADRLASGEQPSPGEGYRPDNPQEGRHE